MRHITEENDKPLIDEWKREAGDMTLDKLEPFVRRLTTEYAHDYGTVCHAIHAAMKAAFSAVNKSPAGGITGFQASCIGWMLVRDMFLVGEDAALRLVDYDDMLYPQYRDKFTTISGETWLHLREKARKLLESEPAAHPDVLRHWQSVVDGAVPFGLRVD